MHIHTGIRIHWLWLVLRWSWDGDTDRWLLNAIVIIVEERNAFGNVIGSCRAAITVPVWRDKRLRRILWPLKAVLISLPLSQTV